MRTAHIYVYVEGVLDCAKCCVNCEEFLFIVATLLKPDSFLNTPLIF